MSNQLLIDVLTDEVTELRLAQAEADPMSQGAYEHSISVLKEIADKVTLEQPLSPEEYKIAIALAHEYGKS